jgi:hypothetical protein
VCDPRWIGVVGGNSSSSPAVGSGSVFFTIYTADHGWLVAFPAGRCGVATCSPSWRALLGGQTFSTASVAGGRVYAAASEGQIDVFDAHGCGQSRCTPLWQFETGTTFLLGAPAFAGDTMYVAADGTPDPNTVGVVQAFPASGCGASVCQPTWTGVNFGFGLESSPAIAGGVVFVAKGAASGVRVDAGLYSYDMRGCGRLTCAPLDFHQVGVAENYLGSSVAVGEGHTFFVADDNNAGVTKLYALTT